MIAVFASSHRQAADALCGFDADNWRYINHMTDMIGCRFDAVLFIDGWEGNVAYQSINLRCAFQDSVKGGALAALNAALAAECTRRMNEPKEKSSDKGFEDIRI